MKRLAWWALAATIPLSIAVHLVEVERGRMLLSHPGAVDEVTLLSRIDGVLDAVYLPAEALTFLLSTNVHQPSDLAAAVALVAQTFAMAFLVGGVVVLLRRLARSGAAPPRPGQ